MEQEFQLKYHGDYSIFEQCYMSGEERSWVAKRLKKQFEDEQKQSQGGSGGGPPSRPSVPNVPKPNMPSVRN